MRPVLWSLILLTTLLAGCASQPTSNTRSDSTSRFDLNSFEGFSQALEQSMIAKDTSLFLDSLDSQQFAKRSLGSLKLKGIKDSSLKKYARSMNKLLQSRFKNAFSAVKSASFVRLVPKSGNKPDEAVALMRIEPKDGGISYWEVYLRRSKGGVTVIDWLNYSIGELASTAIADFTLNLGSAVKESDSADAKSIKAFLATAASRDPQKSLEAYEQLPTGFKHGALVTYSHIQTANKVSADAYQTALSELESRHKNDDTYALLLVDFYLIIKDYDKAHQALSTMASLVGEDAGLDSLHAGIAVQSKEYIRALAYARDGINRERTYENNYWVSLDALVFSENYADAVLVLDILGEGFGYTFNSNKMATLEEYKAFTQSAPYKDWYTALSN